VAGLIAGLLFGRGWRFEVLGVPISMHGLYTPVFALTALVLARLVLLLRPRFVPVRSWSPAAVRALLIGMLACAGPLSPVLYGLGATMTEGRFVAPPTLWRSSPRGVDVLALVEFNPNHPLARSFDDRQTSSPADLSEYTAAFSFVLLIVIGLAAWRAGYRPGTGWMLLTAGFAALSLGPFINFSGVNTYIPGPWALLRYVPIIGVARTPTRFVVVAALGAAILLAGALAAIGRRYPERRRLIGAVIGLALVLELSPAPRTLYSATIPAIYDIIAADPRPVRIVRRSGISARGISTIRRGTARSCSADISRASRRSVSARCGRSRRSMR
jgi:hypothetical protein